MDKVFKVLVVGGSGSGKSCLLLRYADDVFTETFISTIGVDFKIKTEELEPGEKCKVQLWDTAGQERFRTITNAYYRGAGAACVVFDLTDVTSFYAAEEHMERLRAHCPDAKIMLVGNKLDQCPRGRQVPSSMGSELAETQGLLGYLETSAKTGHNVREAIMSLVRSMHSDSRRRMVDREKELLKLSASKPLRSRDASCCVIL